MGRTPIDEAGGLTVADVIHKRFSALPADATVAQVRDWFATSSHRQMAFLEDHGRYAASLRRDDLDEDLVWCLVFALTLTSSLDAVIA